MGLCLCMYSRLSRWCTARGSCSGLVTIGPTKMPTTPCSDTCTAQLAHHTSSKSDATTGRHPNQGPLLKIILSINLFTMFAFESLYNERFGKNLNYFIFLWHQSHMISYTRNNPNFPTQQKKVSLSSLEWSIDNL